VGCVAAHPIQHVAPENYCTDAVFIDYRADPGAWAEALLFKHNTHSTPITKG
jgi:hypothetical protein